MMNFSTAFGDRLLIHGQEDAVIGTAMLGSEFGTIKSARLKRSGEVIELDDGGGGLRSIVILHPGVEMELECAFDRTITAPRHLDIITLPIIGIRGRVMPGVEVMWEAGKERGLKIPVSQWDSLRFSTAYRVNPVTGVETSLDDDLPGVRTCDSTIIKSDSSVITCDSL